jgi:hypothetical protein
LSFETVVKKILVDVEKVIEFVPEHVADAVEVVTTIIKEDPIVTSDVKQLIGLVDAVVADVAIDVAAKGLDIVEDKATLTALVALAAFVKGPLWTDLTTAYKALKTDVAAAPVAAAPVAAAKVAA